MPRSVPKLFVHLKRLKSRLPLETEAPESGSKQLECLLPFLKFLSPSSQSPLEALKKG